MNPSSYYAAKSLAKTQPIHEPNKQTKFIEKLIKDLEELCKKLIDLHESNQNDPIRDDCYELQKFCAKLEYLIQFSLKDKKGSANLASNSTNPEASLNSSREYWSFIVDVLKSSRSFEDAIKYVKNINEIKTSMGRARAFIRFCLQYHRLADAVQQLTMEDKVMALWYKEQAVWYNQEYKARIIQFLYDLSDVNFELIARNNFELDTTWPTIQLNSKQTSRNRTNSLTSYSSINIDRDREHVKYLTLINIET